MPKNTKEEIEEIKEKPVEKAIHTKLVAAEKKFTAIISCSISGVKNTSSFLHLNVQLVLYEGY